MDYKLRKILVFAIGIYLPLPGARLTPSTISRGMHQLYVVTSGRNIAVVDFGEIPKQLQNAGPAPPSFVNVIQKRVGLVLSVSIN